MFGKSKDTRFIKSSKVKKKQKKSNSKEQEAKIIIDDEIYYLDSKARLTRFKEEFEQDKSNYNYEEFDTFERIYRGSADTRGNRNSTSSQSSSKANVVRNFTSEFIEAKVDVSMPVPSISAKKPGTKDIARMIQEKIKSDIYDMDIKKYADVIERNTFMHGLAISLVSWNENLGAHEHIGEKEIINYHPKQVIPESGVYELDLMRRIHLMDSKSKDAIFQEYGVDISALSDEFPSFNHVQTDDDSLGETIDDKVTRVTRFYIDEDGDIGKFVWVENVVLEDYPKYYYPRMQRCTACKSDISLLEEECQNCNGHEFIPSISTYEILDSDIQLMPINYAKTQKLVKYDGPMGEARIDETAENVIVDRFARKGEKVKIKALKIFPIAIRKNIPYNFMFRGRSDVELISDLQESYKKILSRIEEKLLNSSGIIAYSRKLNLQLTNKVYSILKGSPADISSIQKIDTQSHIQEDLLYLQSIYEYAQSTIGITPSFQGKYDSSASSGKAKEIQVNQASAILQSPHKNKLAYYARLFKIMFYFDINFTIEERPYMVTDSQGEIEYKVFNKYELLMRDDSKELYMNTDFTFRAEKGEEIPKNKQFIYGEIVAMAQSGLLDKEQLWLILSSIDFPMANQILEQCKQESQAMMGDKMVKDRANQSNQTDDISALLMALDEDDLESGLEDDQIQVNENTDEIIEEIPEEITDDLIDEDNLDNDEREQFVKMIGALSDDEFELLVNMLKEGAI